MPPIGTPRIPAGLLADNQPLELARGLVQRPRRTAVLVTLEKAGDIRWHTVTFAPVAGGPAERADLAERRASGPA